jgi:hypothetical protein
MLLGMFEGLLETLNYWSWDLFETENMHFHYRLSSKCFRNLVLDSWNECVEGEPPVKGWEPEEFVWKNKRCGQTQNLSERRKPVVIGGWEVREVIHFGLAKNNR